MIAKRSNTHKTPGHAKHEAGQRPTEFQSSIDLEATLQSAFSA
jgi:hypothetical protein